MSNRLIDNPDVQKAYDTLGVELLCRDNEKGYVFEVFMLKDANLECYVYPEKKEWEKKFYARSTRPVPWRDFLLYCETNYKKEGGSH